MRIPHLLLSLALLAASPAALAATSVFTNGQGAATATVANTCSLVSASTINFGSYSTIATAPRQIAVSISVRCTQGASGVLLYLGEGSNQAGASSCVTPMRRMKSNTATTEYLSYHVYKDSGYSVPLGCDPSSAHAYTTFGNSTSAVGVSLYAEVPSGQGVKADTYTDSVTYSLNF